MTDNELKGINVPTGNAKNNEGMSDGIKINASMSKIVDSRNKEKGKTIEGNADVNIASLQTYLEINSDYVRVGDCARDGVMPPRELMAELQRRKQQRDRLKGKERTGTERD